MCGGRSTNSPPRDQAPLAAEVLARIAQLYAIEADIRGHRPMRRAVRQQRSRPMVEAMHVWLQEHMLERISGCSDLANAMRYALNIGMG